MGERVNNSREPQDMLIRYGAKWAVLAAFQVDLIRRGVTIPTETQHSLEVSHIELSSGCYSPCEINCELSKVEGRLMALGASFGEMYTDSWMNLLASAFNGEIGTDKIMEIPLLRPVRSECAFLDCLCR